MIQILVNDKFKEVQDNIKHKEKKFTKINTGLTVGFLNERKLKNSCKFFVNVGANKPVKATKFAACYDISAHLYSGKTITVYGLDNKKVVRQVRTQGNVSPYFNLGPGERALIPTGLRTFMPQDMSLRLHPRSGVSIKNGVNLANCEGVVDADYTNEIFVPLINLSGQMFQILNGDRIAQAEFVKTDKTYDVTYEQNYNGGDLPKITDRVGGLASTGVRPL